MSLHDLFRIKAPGEEMSENQFIELISQLTNGTMPLEAIQQVFRDACKAHKKAHESGKEYLSFDNFYKHFTYRTEIVASYDSKGDPDERVIVT